MAITAILEITLIIISISRQYDMHDFFYFAFFLYTHNTQTSVAIINTFFNNKLIENNQKSYFHFNMQIYVTGSFFLCVKVHNFIIRRNATS